MYAKIFFWLRLQKILADDGYSGKPLADEVREKYNWEFESVNRMY